MKCYKFWVRETKKIYIGDVQQPITVLAGSNVSKEDASSNAGQISRSIEERIRKPKQGREEYEASIKEHIAKEIDSKNIITITRYGAQVLNTTEYTILDIDNYTIFLFMEWFRKKSTLKDKIIDKFKRHIVRHPELGTSFRIYETHQGIRIIGKHYFDPQEKNFRSIMRSLGVDPLYAFLCRKQNCYRVRLTPKPYRMKMETIRIKSPLDCETEAYDTWQKKYTEISRNYSVVKLRETMGADFGSDPVITHHDTITNMQAHYPLV